MSKIVFMKYLAPIRPKLTLKIKNAQNLSKSGTSRISGMLISIFMSKIIFVKYLPPVEGKSILKFKVQRIY